jgi:sec-independent protein translocase protein TatA
VIPVGLRDLFEGPHVVVLLLVVVALFGSRRLPDVARGLGRSMRIFKSEMDEMNTAGTSAPSAGSSHTAEDEVARKTGQPGGEPTER